VALRAAGGRASHRQARLGFHVSRSASSVPPAVGVVTRERLAGLLALATEYDELDFKQVVDLSTTRGGVEFAKDVAAMNVKGGHIVIGVDNQGNPTGGMDGADTTVFDAATLVPRMERYMEGPLTIATSLLIWEEHTVVLVCVSPDRRGARERFRDKMITRGERARQTKAVVAS
jgi:predicted HTH transcriptional regulator